MSILETQYKNYLKENPESTFTFKEWSNWQFSNMELPPPHNGLRPIDEYTEELSDWSPYVSDDFQIGPDGAYEHTEDMTPRLLMNKEQIIDEAYQNYVRKLKLQNNWASTLSTKPLRFNTIGQQKLLTKEEFINKCETDPEFSEKWGLKIEERELGLEERVKLTINTPEYRNYTEEQWKEYIDSTSSPTKLITITYNDKTIESYEN